MNWKKLKVRRLGSHWWITGDEEDGPYGPYDKRAEAEAARRGIARSMANVDVPGYWTSKPTKGEAR